MMASGLEAALDRRWPDVSLQYYSRIETRAQIFRFLLYTVAVVLVAYLVYLFTRLRANARALQGANTAVYDSSGSSVNICRRVLSLAVPFIFALYY